MAIHVVNTGLFPIDATGNVITKTSRTTTINTMLTTSMEHRIIPDDSIATSADYPSVKDYLIAEEALGYLLQHMDQTYIVTRKP